MNLLRYIFILLSLCLFQQICKGQLFDTIAKSLAHKPKFDFKLDSRNSFITSVPLKVAGFKIGLEYNETVRLGIGYNSISFQLFPWENQSFIHRKKLIYSPGASSPYEVDARLRLFYLSPYFEYIFHKSKKWEHVMVIMAGFGNSYYDYIDPVSHLEIRENYSPVILYEPLMTTQYKPIPWAGVGFGAGYRVVLMKNNLIKENLTAPIYAFRIKIFFGEIFKSIGNIRKKVQE